jgi:type II secretory pathway component PulJ
VTARIRNGFSDEAWATYSDAVQQLERCREQHQAKYDALRVAAVALEAHRAEMARCGGAADPQVDEALAIIRVALMAAAPDTGGYG